MLQQFPPHVRHDSTHLVVQVSPGSIAFYFICFLPPTTPRPALHLFTRSADVSVGDNGHLFTLSVHFLLRHGRDSAVRLQRLRQPFGQFFLLSGTLPELDRTGLER